MKEFLLFLSKTDKSIYNECPKSAKNNQLALGLFVLLTGILAFCSGTYAVSNLFIDFDGITNEISYGDKAFLYASILGGFYAIIIMAIDREVVSAKNKMAVIPRLCLAIVIGVIVAIPVELKLLEGKIEKKLYEEYKTENAAPINERFKLLGRLENKKNDLNKEINRYQREIERWSENMEKEANGRLGVGRTGIAGYGRKYNEALKMKNFHIDNKKNALEELNKFIDNEYNFETERINNLYNDKQITQQFDLLSKFQALNKIIDDDNTGSTGSMSLGIRLLFILFEIIPSLIKLMTPQSEYDALLEARRRMNIQLTNVRANDAIENIEDIDRIIKDKETKPLPYMDEIKERIMI